MHARTEENVITE